MGFIDTIEELHGLHLEPTRVQELPLFGEACRRRICLLNLFKIHETM